MTAAEYKFVMSYQVAEPTVKLADREVTGLKRSTAASHPEPQHHYVLVVKVMALALLFCLGTVFCYIQGALMAYQVNDIKQVIATLETDNKTLKLAVAELAAPERVESLARTKLGMVRPSEEMMVAVAPMVDEVAVVSLRHPEGPAQAGIWSYSFFNSLATLFSGQQKVGVTN
ncbi:MAG: cell division protein FtsL [Methylocystaceae bacterium]